MAEHERLCQATDLLRRLLDQHSAMLCHIIDRSVAEGAPLPDAAEGGLGLTMEVEEWLAGVDGGQPGEAEHG